MSSIDLLIEPNIKFYTHEEIKKVFELAIDNSNVKYIQSKFISDIFFRVDMYHGQNSLVDIKKEFNDWVDIHDDIFKFEIMNSKIPIVKAHIILVSDEIIISAVRELTYEQAKKEILEYINEADNHKIYVSKIAEKLLIDIDLIVEVLEDIDDEFFGRYEQ